MRRVRQLEKVVAASCNEGPFYTNGTCSCIKSLMPFSVSGIKLTGLVSFGTSALGCGGVDLVYPPAIIAISINKNNAAANYFVRLDFDPPFRPRASSKYACRWPLFSLRRCLLMPFATDKNQRNILEYRYPVSLSILQALILPTTSCGGGNGAAERSSGDISTLRLRGLNQLSHSFESSRRPGPAIRICVQQQ
eukprot:jgi/Chlat1/3341/Chrsp23S03653